MNIKKIKSILEKNKIPSDKHKKGGEIVFLKTDPSYYAEHDRFLGVNLPILRQIAKDFAGLKIEEIKQLIESSFNEERLLALLILIGQYQSSRIDRKREELFQFYMQNLQYINNWNLVDVSAHTILGAHLFYANKDLLLKLAKSKIMCERHIAIIATWYFIRKNELEWTFKIAEILLNDKHDLIHKAVGYMLCEAGKKNEKDLIIFLDQYVNIMPRTMLRYAIEKFPEDQRKNYLIKKYDF